MKLINLKEVRHRNVCMVCELTMARLLAMYQDSEDDPPADYELLTCLRCALKSINQIDRWIHGENIQEAD